mmetsp:Transcript_140482/g.365374  ORF Transcript_140482/g.365374 Transcript_140482/m.365374 type:complete len:277 (-) Transcript_140482:58-888(-)
MEEAQGEVPLVGNPHEGKSMAQALERHLHHPVCWRDVTHHARAGAFGVAVFCEHLGLAALHSNRVLPDGCRFELRGVDEELGFRPIVRGDRPLLRLSEHRNRVALVPPEVGAEAEVPPATVTQIEGARAGLLSRVVVIEPLVLNAYWRCSGLLCSIGADARVVVQGVQHTSACLRDVHPDQRLQLLQPRPRAGEALEGQRRRRGGGLLRGEEGLRGGGEAELQEADGLLGGLPARHASRLVTRQRRRRRWRHRPRAARERGKGHGKGHDGGQAAQA